VSKVLRKTLPLPAGRNSKIETKGFKMESQMEAKEVRIDSKQSKRKCQAHKKDRP